MSLYRVELPYQHDAAGYYAALADLPWAFWLDSCGMARYDIVTAMPVATLVLDAAAPEDSFGRLRGLLGGRDEPLKNVPFAGGALGFWSYDLGCRMMDLPRSIQQSEKLPDMAVGIYDWAVVVDHKLHSAHLVSRQRFAETVALLPMILRRLQAKQAFPADNFIVHGTITPNFTPGGYSDAFMKVQDYLKSGDCYQVNLAQRFSAKAEGNAFQAYLKLRSISPAPYAAFLNLPQAQIMCNSPERFIHVKDGIVETKPIKGTRPRSGKEDLDKRLANELSTHPKDQAENLMIVDLLRSDLGKVCVPGTVRTPKLFEVESYANVHHLVSTVEGQLAVGLDALDVLRACFPGGSITGAPKLRAMQIIEQLEPHRRGLYCGAIGYIGFDGNMDTNIAIRTMIHSGNEIKCWAGGGIVADSEVEAEYQETLDKASAMLELLRQYGGTFDGFAKCR